MWLVVFFGAALLIALTPGANNLVGLHHAMRQSAGKALAGLGARLTAFVLMIAAVAAGLGPLLASSGFALTVIKVAGVAYLVWLGGGILVRAVRTGTVPCHVSGPHGQICLRTSRTVSGWSVVGSVLICRG
ncbi:MAG: hypothetical protein GEU98_29185 [Pseudonocardiaceae bacterium]|nr:hypothetical protein [Pseudonocardiaceae bacterium]